ncbi:MAG: hypothetical protein WB439_15775, partial [Acidobacteriaceae bacterium]
MSEESSAQPPEEKVSSKQEEATPKKRSLVLRIFGWSVLSLVGLVILLAAGATWYTGTADFQRRVGGEVVQTLE